VRGQGMVLPVVPNALIVLKMLSFGKMIAFCILEASTEEKKMLKKLYLFPNTGETVKIFFESKNGHFQNLHFS
jgi:hypothetical protein